MPDTLHPARKRDRVRNFLRPRSPAGASSTDSPTALHTQVVDRTAKQLSANTDTATLYDLRQRILVNATLQLPSDSQEAVEAQRLPGAEVGTLLGRVLEVCKEKKELCEKKRWTFEFGGKVVGLGEKVDNVLGWLDRFKVAGDIAANADPIHVGLPWAGIRVLLEVAISERQQMACLVIGIEHALYLTTRLEAYIDYLYRVQHIEPSVALEASLTRLYANILQFLLKATHMYQQSTPGRMLTSMWKLEDVMDFDSKCDKLAHRVDSDAHACSRKESHDNYVSLKRDLEKLEEIKSISDVTRKIWKSLDTEARTRVLRWISAIPYQDNHRAADSGRTDGTAEWIFEHPKFQAWETTTDSTILWLHGIPGAGKTKLTANVVNRLLRTCTSHNTALAYFYCNRNEEMRRRPLNILHTFIKQLSVSQDDHVIRKEVLEVFEKKEASGFASENMDYEEAENLLLQLMKRRETTLVLDALDECEEEYRRKLMGTFDRFIQEVSIKIFISSRRDGDIKFQLEKKANIGIEATDNQSDIIKYLQDTILKDQQERRKPLSDQLQNEIVETLYVKSGGMFQWVFLQIRHLLSFKLESDIRRNLGKLPRGLPEAYDRIYESIKDQDGSEGLVAIRAIQWIMNSVAPLTPHTLVTAICQGPFEEISLPRNDIDTEFILAACKNLVVLVEMEHIELEYLPRSKHQICQLSHLSVREYFEQERKDVTWLGSKLVATTYLSILLNWQASSEQPIPISEVDPYGERFSDSVTAIPLMIQDFQEFIGLRWFRQLPRSEWIKSSEGTERLREFIVEGSELSAACRNWHKWFLEETDLYITPSWLTEEERKLFHVHLDPTCDPSLLVCALGFDELLLAMLNSRADCANTRNFDGMSVLQLAVLQKRHSTVQLLASFGADLNFPYHRESGENDHSNHTPLMIAAEQGNIEMVELLLVNKVNVKTSNSCGCRLFCGYVLTQAAASGNFELVKLLLTNGAEIEPDGSTLALAVGGHNSHWRIAKFLLDEGANINVHGKYGTPMGVAAQAWKVQRDTSMLQLLLDHGADINIKGSMSRGHEFGRYVIPLAVAAEFASADDIPLIQFLLEHGADVNIKMEEGAHRGILALVASQGYPDTTVARFLLDNGADVNMKLDGHSGSALAAATSTLSLGNRMPIIQLLLDYGADINLKGGLYGSALGAAVCASSYENSILVVQFLLNNRADVNLELDNIYGSALAMAAKESSNNTWAVVELLKNGADVNMKLGGWYGSALAAAVVSYHNDKSIMVQLLIDNGADVNMKLDRDYGSALAAAADCVYDGDTSVVQLLLDNGADVNMKLEGEYDSALAAASVYKDDLSVVKLLLDNGADVNCSGSHGALPYAFAATGCISGLKYLSEQFDINLRLKDSHGRSLLHFAATGGHFGTFEHLFGLGLDPTIPDLGGIKPVTLAYARFGRKAMEKLGSISASEGQKVSQLPMAIPSYESLAHSEQGAHWTPLHWASRLCVVKVIEELVQDGYVDEFVLTDQPKMRWTPASIAVFFNGKEDKKYPFCDLSQSCKQALGLETYMKSEDCIVGKRPWHDTSHKSTCNDVLYCKGCFWVGSFVSGWIDADVEQRIIGPFFRCHDHYQTNYCLMCASYVKTVHAGHNWEYIDDDANFKPDQEPDSGLDSE